MNGTCPPCDFGWEGNITCLRCGRIDESRYLVNAVEFVDGQATSSCASSAAHPAVRYTDLSSKASEGGKVHEMFTTLVSQLGISSGYAEPAMRVWVLARQKQFISGRRRELVVGAAVYVACRMPAANHVEAPAVKLSDIASKLGFDVGGQDVKNLNSTYRALSELWKAAGDDADPESKVSVAAPAAADAETYIR
jgi:transcription initiation factor TFIIIB Brf1 subunit/transcription initiation factor TFIIB